MRQWQLLVLLLVLFLISVSNSSVVAETTASATVLVSWEILPSQSLTIAGEDSSGTTVLSRFDLCQPTNADFALGYIEENGALTLIAASNIPWTVKVAALEANMGASNDGSYVKPLSDFSLRANGASYLIISRFDQTLASGEAGAHPLIIDYKVKTEEDSYKDGEYGLTLVYTITSD